MFLQPFTAMDNAFESVMEEMSAIQPREFHPELEYTQPGELDFLKDAYEVGKDGRVSCPPSSWISYSEVAVTFECVSLRKSLCLRAFSSLRF